MVLQIATGLEPPIEIARRFGFTDDEFGELSQWEPFVREVEQKKVEFKTSGRTFQLTSAGMAEMALPHLFLSIMSPDATFNQKLEGTRALVEWGNLKPKQSLDQAKGTGFTININFSKRAAEGRTIEVTAEPDEPIALENPFAVAVDGT